MTQKLAIIGASAFQNPLILKAKDMGIETHVFAWECGDLGEKTADYFYPISITEIGEITEKCREIGIDGICSIGTDLGNIAVSAVASALGLCANSVDCVKQSTNKYLMRRSFFDHGDPSPWSVRVQSMNDLEVESLTYPIIVKPVDRSGSRAITRLEGPDGLECAVAAATEASFDGAAVVEEFFEGNEYSVEFVSWKGEHHFLALTEKFTTGAPHFIETGHLQPPEIDSETLARIQKVVAHALDGLGVEFGASHSEILINSSGEIRIVEIGSRMGGDCIGSDLVELSTGVDFLRAVISISLGIAPDLKPLHDPAGAMIRFVFGKEDIEALNLAADSHDVRVEKEYLSDDFSHEIIDSGSRYGFFILSAETNDLLMPYLPRKSF